MHPTRNLPLSVDRLLLKRSSTLRVDRKRRGIGVRKWAIADYPFDVPFVIVLTSSKYVYNILIQQSTEPCSKRSTIQRPLPIGQKCRYMSALIQCMTSNQKGIPSQSYTLENHEIRYFSTENIDTRNQPLLTTCSGDTTETVFMVL